MSKMAAVAVAVKAVPSTLTNTQQCRTVEEMFGIAGEDYARIGEFMVDHCPSLVTSYAKLTPLSLVLTPSLDTFYDCDRPLVSDTLLMSGKRI